MIQNQRLPLPRLALAFLLFLAFLLWNCSGSATFSSDQRLRVLTYNIHHGEGTDGKIDIKRIARVILESRADIVALQEVDRTTKRSNNVDLLTALADETGMTYAFGKTIDFQGGAYGNGILTKFPILEERNRYLKGSGAGEQRAAMILVLDCFGQEIVLLNTHFDHREDDRDRFSSVEELLRFSREDSTRPIIVCGDFNDVPESRAIVEMQTVFLDSWKEAGTGKGLTYSTVNPQQRIDYIFYLNKAPGGQSRLALLKAEKAAVIQSTASDHLPLLVEFRLGGQ